ncbi:hypothetical protein G7046_g8224 [Stylonectria norvegica]|nr:hypothetical protein G7046_g8224 [Stylonectria norvegica]
MHFFAGFSTLAVAAAGLLASAHALSSQDIASDLPVSSLLTSAQAHLSRGETSEALVYYDAAIARDPTNYLTLFKRATTYLSLGKPNQATDDYNRVLFIKPNFEAAHLQLAKIRATVGDWETARAQYKRANRGSDSDEVHDLDNAKLAAGLADLAQKSDNWAECVTHADAAILVASRSPALRDLRARCRFELGDVEQGVADLRHILQMKPRDTAPHVIISATTFYALANQDNGLAQIKKCLHSDPDSKVCKKLHRQEKAVQKVYKKAQGQLQRKQPTTAGRTLVGTTDEPGLVPMIRKQVDELRENGNIPTRARALLLEEVVEMACQAYVESNHKDAAKYCDESLSLHPESFWGLIYKGKSLLKKEDYEAAIRTLEQAAKAGPDKQETFKPILDEAQIALRRSKTKDYYKVLEVANDADERQIKAAYRRASKQYHPDKSARQDFTREEAEKKMAAINEAYEVLSDPELRQRFDRGDDPNNQERPMNPFQGAHGGGRPIVFEQGGGFKFQFNY